MNFCQHTVLVETDLKTTGFCNATLNYVFFLVYEILCTKTASLFMFLNNAYRKCLNKPTFPAYSPPPLKPYVKIY